MTLLELFQLLRKHLGIVIALPLVAGVITAAVSFFLPDQYTATTSMYVLSRSDAGMTEAITQQDLSAGQMLTNDVATILRSDRVKADVAAQFGLENLKGFKLDVTSSTTTRVITLAVTSTDPQAAADVANALVTTTSEVAVQVMQIQSVNVVDAAAAPLNPSGPPRLLYTAIGLLAGLFLAVALVVIADAADTRVRNGQDVQELLGVPVIGHFPKVERS